MEIKINGTQSFKPKMSERDCETLGIIVHIVMYPSQ